MKSQDEINKTGRKNPELWDKAKKLALTKFDNKHSARMIQYAGRLYREMGGKYTKDLKENQLSLKKWTNEKWTTKSGEKSSVSGERYLPSKVIKNLSDKDYKRTSKLKKEGKKQYIKQPDDIIQKIKNIKEGKKNYKTIGGFKYFISDNPKKKLMTVVDNKKINFGKKGDNHYRDKTGLLSEELNDLDKEERKLFLMKAKNLKDKDGNLKYLNPKNPIYHEIKTLW